MGYPIAAPAALPQAARCPVCSEGLSEAPVSRCAVCQTPHHAQCWTYNRRCGVYGCTSRMAVEPDADLPETVEKPLLSRTMSQGWILFWLLGGMLGGWIPGLFVGALLGIPEACAGISYFLLFFGGLIGALTYRVDTEYDPDTGVLTSTPWFGAPFERFATTRSAAEVEGLVLEFEGAANNQQGPHLIWNGYLRLHSGEKLLVMRKLQQTMWSALQEMNDAAEAMDVPLQLDRNTALLAMPALETARKVLGGSVRRQRPLLVA